MLAPDAMCIVDEQIGKTISKSSPVYGLELDGVRFCGDAAGEVFCFAAVEEADAFLVGFIEESTGDGGQFYLIALYRSSHGGSDWQR